MAIDDEVLALLVETVALRVDFIEQLLSPEFEEQRVERRIVLFREQRSHRIGCERRPRLSCTVGLGTGPAARSTANLLGPPIN